MSDFKLNRSGLGLYLRSDEVKDEMEKRGKKIMARAIAIAPVGRNDSTIGASKKKVKRYKDSFKLTTGVRKIGGRAASDGPPFKTRRAFARVENTKTYAVFVEYGVIRTIKDKDGNEHIVRTGAHRTLGRAIDAAR